MPNSINQFTERSKYSSKGQTKLSWGNKMFSTKLNHIFNPRLNGDFSMSYTQYQSMISMKYNHIEEYMTTTNDSKVKTEISDFIADVNMEYLALKNSKIRFGLSNTVHEFSPIETSYSVKKGTEFITDTVWDNTKLLGISNAGYLLLETFVRENFSSNIGMRLSHYYINEKHYLNFEPRLLLNCNIKGLFAIKAAYSEMQQNVHMLNSSNFGIPFDIWYPATDIIEPATSRQLTLGIAKSFYNNSLELSIEGYNKEMNGLISYKEGRHFSGYYDDWLNIIEISGTGKSKGIEFLVKKKKGELTGIIGYTLSKATRQFDNINNGEVFLYNFDRTHDVNIMLTYQINNFFNISATWVYGTGNPFSLPIGRISTVEPNEYFNDESVFNSSSSALIYNAINNYRMRDFHRLDVGINHIKHVKYGERIINFSIYNVYNRQNPFYYYLEFNEEKQNFELRQQSIFPIMPSVSYTLKFNKDDLKDICENYKEKCDYANRKLTKHRVGGQFNPYLLTESSADRQFIYAVRYAYAFTTFFSSGLEYSGIKKENHPNSTVMSTSQDYNYGGFLRFTYPRPRYIQPFLEANLYFAQNIQTNEYDDYRASSCDFKGFVAPGVSFVIMDQYVNVDIFYKISNKNIINDKKRVVSYRVCVNFGQK